MSFTDSFLDYKEMMFIGQSSYIYNVYFCLLPVFHWQATIMGPVSSLL